MKIRIISPVANHRFSDTAIPFYVKHAPQDVELSFTSLTHGPESIESNFEDALAAPFVVRRALEAERDGMDAVIIDCMNDPGMDASRDVATIPVVGAAQSAMMLASILADRFTVISTSMKDKFPIENLVRRYGLHEKYASTRAVEIPVLELESNPQALVDGLFEQTMLALQYDGARAIVLGCTCMRSASQGLRQKLAEHNISIPVIDPSVAALRWAKMLVDLKLSHSLLTHPRTENILLAKDRQLEQQTLPEYRGTFKSHARVRVMVPVVQGYRPENWLEEGDKAYKSYASPDTQLTTKPILEGPETVENFYLKANCIPGMLRLAREAEAEGQTACIIDCMSDPSLDAAREAVSIPVIGATQACAYISASLAHRFSLLGTRGDMGHKFVTQITEYGIERKLASVRTTGLSVQEVETEPDKLVGALVDAAEKAVVQDGAHILIPGCTGMIGLAEALQNDLQKRGLQVQVIEPPAAAVKMAELLSDLNLSHSKVTYPTPPHKRLVGYEDLQY